MTENSLATELLHEVKSSAKRWFIAFCIMVGLEIATIIGFMRYISLPTDDYSVSQESDNNSVNILEGTYNGSEADGEKNEESSQSEKYEK